MTRDAIAIVGFGGIFPGSATLDQFWSRIASGTDAVTEVPPGRWVLPPPEAFAPGRAMPDRVYSTRGCFVESAQLELGGLGLDPEMVGALDPAFQLALHAGAAAWRSCQTEAVDRSRVDVVLGNIALPTEHTSRIAVEVFERVETSTHRLNRYSAGLPAGLVARGLGLGGNTIALDAACASSLFALELGVDALATGRADAVLAGGLARTDSLYTQMGFSQLRALSASGRCAPFDARADGLVVGEGAGVVVLKRLDDALAQGDEIHAVIRGIGLSNDVDGRLLAPSTEGQLRAMRAAYRQAGWSPEDVDLIECHGTGTPAGDAVEVASLRELWGTGNWTPGQCVIGSVKSNVGHLLTGAGAAGLIKVLLALKHETLPPTANFEHPGVDLDRSPFKVLKQTEPWTGNGSPRRAAVSGFGFGGTNAHVLLEEWVPNGSPHSSAARRAADEPQAPEPIAIVGMAGRFGPWESLDALRERLLGGDADREPLTKARFWGLDDPPDGYFIENLRIGLRRFRIPPSELEDMLPQQLLMLQVAADAAADAAASAGHVPGGVFIGLSLDLNTTHYHLRWSQLARGETPTNGPPLSADRTMGSLGSIVASRIARELSIGGPSYVVSSEETSGLTACDVAVRALRAGTIDSALVGAVDFTSDPRAVRTEAPDRDVLGDGAAAFVLKRLSDVASGERVYAVIEDVGTNVVPEDVMDAADDVGFTGAASGLASLLKAALCLHHEVRSSRYWVHDSDSGPRRTGVRATSITGLTLGVALHSAGVSDVSQPLGASDEGLFVTPMESLGELERRASAWAGGIEALARSWWNEHKHGDVALIARSTEELGRLLHQARAGIRTGRIIAADPRVKGGDVAFVYPGSGNHFPRMGAALSARFPGVLRAQHMRTPTHASQLAADIVWDGDAETLDANPKALLQAQVSVGTILTDLMTWFGVRPQAAIGYSLGESTALFALRAWQGRNEMLRRIDASTLFTQDLVSERWCMGVVDRPAISLQPPADVYVLIANTPSQTVIGGDIDAVRAFVDLEGLTFRELRGTTTVHCDVMRPFARSYRELHLLPTTAPPRIRFYSGAWGRAYDVTKERAADAVLAQALEGVDFPKTIEQAYADGARLFVELGPGNSCTRMVSDILGDRPHAAVASLLPSGDPVGLILRVLGTLAVHDVPVDFSALYGSRGPRDETVTPDGPQLVVPVGGDGAPARRAVVPPPEPELTPAPEPIPVSAPVSSVPAPVPISMANAGFHRVHHAVAAAHRAFLETSTANAAAIAALYSPRELVPSVVAEVPVALDRQSCLRFATGLIGDVLGDRYAEIDSFPTRVRLPDGPLMLVDRIPEIDAQPLSMTPGRLVTEHDVHSERWYLEDQNVIPAGVSIEAGQADLFLSGYVGIDFETRGESMYRLLDAVVTFHRGLPGPGDTIRYDIRIRQFFQQSGTWFFRFEFDAMVDGEPLMTMREGLAGFFSSAELDAGEGIKLSTLDRREWVAASTRPSTASARPPAASAPIPAGLPTGRLQFVHRIPELDIHGGRYGLGLIRTETDIAADDWFLTCHFVDDPVMPGTLMYESSMQSLRVLMMRLGHDTNGGTWEPVPGVASRLKCRGQVTAETSVVQYEIHVKEIGEDPVPYAIADCAMYADGRHIVEVSDLSLRLSGARPPTRRTYDKEHILTFATGNPSDAFGAPYRPFDNAAGDGRYIARLPAEPYSFIDRIVRVTGRPFEFVGGGEVDAEVTLPSHAWHFDANGQPVLSYAVLNEIALQPCGWLAAYIGSALTSETDLHFRNLGGRAVVHRSLARGDHTLATHAVLTSLSKSADTIILHYDFRVSEGGSTVYEGNTYFGFFTPDALANQVGVRDEHIEEWPAALELIPDGLPPFPDPRLQMLDEIHLGDRRIDGLKRVRSDDWFFKAHFIGDPVWPGSLGLEAFLQLLKASCVQRWGRRGTFDTIALGAAHAWTYRGQVTPNNKEVRVQAHITEVDEANRIVRADGVLSVDGLVIYQMKDFAMAWRRS